MNDREMLEKAAKAAEIDVVRSRLDDPACADMLINNSPRNVDQRFGPWNPLTDDGDALRLAVKLRINIPWQTVFPDTTPEEEMSLIRRAIVRAAASIGPTP